MRVTLLKTAAPASAPPPNCPSTQRRCARREAEDLGKAKTVTVQQTPAATGGRDLPRRRRHAARAGRPGGRQAARLGRRDHSRSAPGGRNVHVQPAELHRGAIDDALFQPGLAGAMAEDRRGDRRRRMRRRQGGVPQHQGERRARQPAARTHGIVVHRRVLHDDGGRALDPDKRQIPPASRRRPHRIASGSGLRFHRRRPGNSNWTLASPDGRRYNAAYEGAIWIDKDTRRVLRIEQRTTGLPQDFPLSKAETVLTYAFVKIDNKPYLLPAGSETSAAPAAAAPAPAM